ncbi:DUF6896 domain-containing protein [Actinocorallia libanotica]|uniref:DUF6896 domain-containing protein n=1 Tax=Actinocorallia libanotica TaxID=46162 RepID=A0ABP4BHM0_9ACTN
MEPRDLVLAFVQQMTELATELTNALSMTTGGNDLRSVVAAVRQKQLPREGGIPGGLRYRVHGAGCWIKTPDGVEIDADLGPGPFLLKFDAWRIRLYADSIGEEAVTDQEISEALRDLADQGLISRFPSSFPWYTFTAQKDDHQEALN